MSAVFFKVLKFLNKKSIKKGNKTGKIQNIRIIPIFPWFDSLFFFKIMLSCHDYF